MKIILLLTMLFFFSPGVRNAGAGGDGEISADFMRNLLGGDKFERELLEAFPGGELKWTGEVLETGEERFICLVYSEFSRPGMETLFQLYEITVRYVPLEELLNEAQE